MAKREGKFRVGQVVAYLDDAGGQSYHKIRYVEENVVNLFGMLCPRSKSKIRALSLREIGPARRKRNGKA